jgi:hypothetical protein
MAGIKFTKFQMALNWTFETKNGKKVMGGKPWMREHVPMYRSLREKWSKTKFRGNDWMGRWGWHS